jgi:hypothetical protein
MMGDQNDKQRRCFWSFMDQHGRCGMTPMTAVGPHATFYVRGVQGCFRG